MKIKAELLSDYKTPQSHRNGPQVNQEDQIIETPQEMEERSDILETTPQKPNSIYESSSSKITPRSVKSSKGKSPHPKILSKINGTREKISKINMKITERIVLRSNLAEMKNKYLQIEKKLNRFENESKNDKSA